MLFNISYFVFVFLYILNLLFCIILCDFFIYILIFYSIYFIYF